MSEKSQDPFEDLIQVDDTPPPASTPQQPTIPVPTLAEVQASIASFTESMNNFDTVTTDTAKVRQTLLKKLLPTALEMDMSVDSRTDPDLYAAQTRLYGEVRQLLNDMDTSARQHVNTKLKQKDQEINQQNSINAAELLKHIKLNTERPMGNAPEVPQSVLEQAIEEQFKERGCLVVPETELIENDCQLPEKKASEEL